MANPPLEPFFLRAARGERFCLFYPASGTLRGAIVYVHPFAEEMNKSRRVVAAQSRLLASHGYSILQIDLFGCGDSSGEFRDARWETWISDVAVAVQWIKRHVPGPLHIWGLRLGALLALDYAASSDDNFDGFVLWQPVLSGEAFISQFLRLRVASGMMSGDANVSTQRLRAQLQSGATVEVAGYELAPELAHAIDRVKLLDRQPRLAPVYWFDIMAGPAPVLPPVARRVVEAWVSHGMTVEALAVSGEPFWNTVELVDSPQLLAETARMLRGVYA